VENGVDLSRFGDGGPTRADVRARIGLNPADIVIGQVANFRHNKNHLFMLRAFQRAFAGRNDVKLVFIGQGFEDDTENSQPAIEFFVREHRLVQQVKFLGYRADVHELLRAFDVFGLVSYKEGLPLSVIEAMAAGLPVLVTDIEAMKGIVQQGVNGSLVTPDDVEGLASAMGGLVADAALRQRMGKQGRELAHGRYSFARCLSQTEELLASAASRHALRKAR
jgi:glycosyltransferase involved in cell wall biosynthesis